MRKEHLKYGFMSLFMIFALSLLVSCGGGGGDEESTPATASISLARSIDSIPADGHSSVSITATVRDAAGSAVSIGTPITFTTTLGSFQSGGTTYGIETPDDSGSVTVSLMAGTTSGTARVTASASGVTQRIDVLFSFDGNTGVPVAEEFGLFAQYLNISGLWRMNLEDQITAGLGDVYGNAVKNDILVDFKTYNTGGFITPETSATASGFASTSLFSTAGPAPMQGFVSVTAETEGGPTTRVTAIEVTPFPDNHIVYSGTNGGGIYKSTDSGQTWENISRSSLNLRSGENFIGPYIKGHSAICVDPDDHNAVYAGTGYLGKGNVFRSLDGGMNWNSNNVEEWYGLYNTNTAILTVLCDGDDDPLTDYPYVWIGTEGQGILYATDGAHFQPSGGIVNPIAPTQVGSPIYVNPSNTGNGYMTEPTLWYSSKTEDWTATCYIPEDATATVPELTPTGDPAADGWMSNVDTSLQTMTEDWTVTYTGSAGTVYFSQGSAAARDPGSIIDIAVSPNGETWTVECIDATTEEFSVEGTVSGRRSNATFGTPYSETEVGFTFVDGPDDFVAGDRFMFTSVTNLDFTPNTAGNSPGTLINIQGTTAEDWTVTCTDDTIPGAEVFSVTGSVTGALPDATFGVDYNEPELAFSFQDGTDDFEIGDQFDISAVVNQVNFYPAGVSYSNPGSLGNIAVVSAVSETWTVRCIDATDVAFSVTGSVSGAQPNAAIGDYSEEAVSFTINDGPDPWLVGSRFTFSTTTFWQVSGTVSGAQTNTATTGAYYTSDGNEVGFTIHAGGIPFSAGDEFKFSTTAPSSPFWMVEGSESGLQSLPAQNGVLYRSDNHEVSFMIVEGSIPFVTGDEFRFHVDANDLNHGRTVWDLERVAGTHGADAILYAGTATGVFRSTNGGRTWTEPRNFTGDYVISIALHPTSTGGVNDVIYAGTQNGAVWVSIDSGTSWTQYFTGIKAGSFIKDLVLDPTNNFLYALTYEIEAATGAVYVHAINADGSMGTEGWKKVSTGLPGTALHAMAIDNPVDPGALFAGGEGISLSRSVAGLDTGNPTWQESKDGLSNLIMARMPVLFSGVCWLDVRRVRYDNLVCFTIYLQDSNGNPPITGSKFTATYKPEGGDEVVFYDLEYCDCYTHQGTFSDPSNGYTNNPYGFCIYVSAGDEVEVKFEPANTLPDVPGSSGTEETLTYMY